MKKYLLATGFLLTLTPLWSQGNHPQDLRRARALYMQAQSALDDGNMTQAMAYLDMATKADSTLLDAWAQLGSISLNRRQYAQARLQLGRALEIDSNRDAVLSYDYAKALGGLGDFQDALWYIQRYLEFPDLDSSQRIKGRNWQARYLLGRRTQLMNLPFDPVNLGPGVNTADAEYFPSLTVDQKTMIFTRNLQGHNEDFFISHPDSNGHWEMARNLGPPVNTPGNEGTAHISQDGRFLLFAGCDRADGAGSCDIYYSIKTPGGWSPPQNIGAPVNTRFWESQPCLSPDNRDLYFVSNRPGGYGGSDIYVSHLGTDGRWSDPVNLGPHINTSGDETSPFIHADNQTLYFASDGWPGLGGMDLFYSRRQPDGSWGKAVNLGYPINTIGHDGSLFVAADGKTAYYASDRANGQGQLDLYRFILYEQARPIRTLYVEGTVYDSLSRRPLAAEIILGDLDSGSILTRVYSDARGHYLVTLPLGRDYSFIVDHPGYLFYSAHYSLKGQSPDHPFRADIPLQPIAAHARVTLNNIFFRSGSYELLPRSFPELDRLLHLLTVNPGIRIRINGYTDNTGTAASNLVLSQRRAESVVRYLVSKGIQASRLCARGYGETVPRGNNRNALGRALNRRTEFVILGPGATSNH